MYVYMYIINACKHALEYVFLDSSIISYKIGNVYFPNQIEFENISQ